MTPYPVARLCAELGIDERALADRGLRQYAEARELVFVDTGAEDRDHFLVPRAAADWHRMAAAARADGVALMLASSFRSTARQAALIRKRLEQGRTIDDILTSVAAPGYSEHHTGRAVDIVTPEHPDLEEAFEATAAFAWLTANAGRFGFAMSYPRGNATGYIYEPWHWCHRVE
ncbi:MAG: D-alanyl-D-alanine carboxypeptidase family protein [Betaproteobacteria bacterium]|nr:D-alanyl-D-alanine carboxypeptidase family protein [Betaproteobacteria bacterium]